MINLEYKLIDGDIWLFVDGVMAANFGDNQGALTKVMEIQSESLRVQRSANRLKKLEEIVFDFVDSVERA